MFGRSEEQLEAILNNSTAVVYLKDLEGRYIFVNSQFETVLHVSNEELRGKTDHAIFPKEVADTLRKNDLDVLKKGGPIELEEFVPHDDGLHAFISIKFPLFNAEGQPESVCGISTV